MNYTVSTNHIHFSDPESEQYFQTLSQKLISHSEIEGKHHGLQNKPGTEDEYLALAHNNIEITIQEGIHFNQQRHQPISGIVAAKQIQNAAQNEATTKRASLIDTEHELQQLMSGNDISEPSKQRQLILMLLYMGTGINSIAEGWFGFEALLAASFPILPALFSSLAIAVVAGFCTHTFADFIRKSKNYAQYVIRWTIVLVPSFLFFYVLGHLRADAYNNIINLNPNEIVSSPSVSGWKIAIISFLLFVAAISFAIKYGKTDEESLQDKKEDEKERRVAKLKSLKAQKEKEINQIISEGNEQAAQALSRYEFALSFENRLITLAKQAQEKYKEKNLRYRTDQLCPVFFTRPVPFKFTLFFDNVKPK